MSKGARTQEKGSRGHGTYQESKRERRSSLVVWAAGNEENPPGAFPFEDPPLDGGVARSGLSRHEMMSHGSTSLSGSNCKGKGDVSSTVGNRFAY